MILPDAVLAFKLLDGTNLNVKERQLALTACSALTFLDMKSALKRIFGETASKTVGAAAITVKQEKVYMGTSQRTYTGNQRSSYRNVQKWPTSQQLHVQSHKKTNPLNKFGYPTKCAVCQSIFHWAKNCPDKAESVKVVTNEEQSTNELETVEKCNITLFTRDNEMDHEILVTESFGSAVIDTACTKTVCGEKWMNMYLKMLNDEGQRNVCTSKSEQSFKFGDGEVKKSFLNVTIPAKIGSTACKIETEVVKSDIPLLLSKASLKKANTVIDLQNDTAVMFGENVNLEFNSSGHYCVNILDRHYENNQDEEVLIAQENMTTDQKKKKILKLHKQFGHASVERLTKLIKTAGNGNSEILGIIPEIVNNCSMCLKFKKPSPKPAVGLPLATEFNETVAMDLHELGPNLWYLHIIDEFTRFSAGCIVRSKQSSIIANKFIRHWIAIHGACRRIYTDNGGEFNNAELRDMAENFNIEVKTTPAYSPWSNGLLERHNFTLTEILVKTKEENKLDWETALGWALAAKNSLHNVHGYSPYQLVYGRNPNIPSVLTDKLPALEGCTRSDIVGKHINALHASRKAFAESECSERIRRALRKQTRPYSGCFVTGDKVYYQRPDNKAWKGPGTVIGQDGVVVFVRHGGLCVRVHQIRLQRAINIENTTCSEPSMKNDVNDNENEQFSESDEDEQNNFELNEDRSGQETPVTDRTLALKTGQVVQFQDQTNTLHEGKILGRAGKATGKYKQWYNIQYYKPDHLTGTTGSVDLGRVDQLTINEIQEETTGNDGDTSSIEENVMILDSVSFYEAKCNELQSWKENKVFDEISDDGQKCVSTRWICTLKETKEGIKSKARLVARGFEESQISHIPKDSPTCSTEALRIILAIMAQNQWKPNSVDIKTAFLQGIPISRNLYIRPPREANASGKIWKLNKCVYGLADASLQWYCRVKDILLECSAMISKVDPAVFYWKDENNDVHGILACHVDDFIWGGDQMFVEAVIPKLRSMFNVGREETETFKYVGIELEQREKILHLRQQDYVNNLVPIELSKARSMQQDYPLTNEEHDKFRSKIGQILWVARQSRPDTIFDACHLASSLKNATVNNILEANKVIKRLKSETVELKFQCLGDVTKIQLIAFSDASLGNLPDGGYQGGYLIVLMGENGKFSPLCWQSKRIRRVVRSSLAGETLALADVVDSAIFIATLYAELTTGKPTPLLIPITCIVDNRSLYEAIKSTKSVAEKRLRLEITNIKELVNNGQIKTITWCATKEQLADCLTKKGASTLKLLKTLSEGKLDI